MKKKTLKRILHYVRPYGFLVVLSLLCAAVSAGAQVLCIDRVKLTQGDYLDVGTPVGPAIPVVIKTLILSK